MKRTCVFLILTCLLLPACNSTAPTSTAGAIAVQYTPAAAAWLATLYDCAGAHTVTAEQRAADFLDLQSIDLAIRIGQPANLTTPAYQIGSEELLVSLNSQNPLDTLTAEQVRGLFTGQTLNWQEINGSNAPVQVWVYSAGEDLQQIFEQAALGDSPATSTARLATGMEEMAQAISKDVNAVGFLTRHWIAGNVSTVYTVARVPVLALTPDEPQGVVLDLLACLQR